jgi:hypothetical protein
MDTKPSSQPKPPKILDAAKARNVFIMNQFATPGLGSLMAGRLFAGACQIMLAVAGFFFIVAWFINVMVQFYGQIEGNVAVKPVGWLGLTGTAIFLLSWVWSLFTSLSIVRASKQAALDKANFPV